VVSTAGAAAMNSLLDLHLFFRSNGKRLVGVRGHGAELKLGLKQGEQTTWNDLASIRNNFGVELRDQLQLVHGTLPHAIDGKMSATIDKLCQVGLAPSTVAELRRGTLSLAELHRLLAEEMAFWAMASVAPAVSPKGIPLVPHHDPDVQQELRSRLAQYVSRQAGRPINSAPRALRYALATIIKSFLMERGLATARRFLQVLISRSSETASYQDLPPIPAEHQWQHVEVKMAKPIEFTLHALYVVPKPPMICLPWHKGEDHSLVRAAASFAQCELQETELEKNGLRFFAGIEKSTVIHWLPCQSLPHLVQFLRYAATLTSQPTWENDLVESILQRLAFRPAVCHSTAVDLLQAETKWPKLKPAIDKAFNFVVEGQTPAEIERWLGWYPADRVTNEQLKRLRKRCVESQHAGSWAGVLYSFRARFAAEQDESGTLLQSLAESLFRDENTADDVVALLSVFQPVIAEALQKLLECTPGLHGNKDFKLAAWKALAGSPTDLAGFYADYIKGCTMILTPAQIAAWMRLLRV
jgi:hypothetical protein